MWTDLARSKANISFGQLILLAPSLKKRMREGATNRRHDRKVFKVHHLYENREPEHKPNGDEEFDFIEIEVEICDKQIPTLSLMTVAIVMSCHGLP